jgi:acetyl-CoA acetyltransferase
VSSFGKTSPAIAANTELTPQRYPDESATDLQRRVVAKLIDENDIAPEDVDGLLAAPAGMAAGRNTDVFTHERLYDELGIQPSFASTVNAGGATYGVMLHQAALAIDAGQAESVLCLGAGKFPRVSEGGEAMARMVSHEEFEFPYGTFIPALYALAIQRHMHEYGTTKEQLARVAVSARRWARQHPDALMRDEGELTIDDVLDSPEIAEPFHRLHCSVPTEGGGSFLVTSGERAAEIADQPAYILGIGEKHTHGSISQAPSFTRMGAYESGKRAFEMASLSPDDVDVAEIYDAFASNPIMYAEDLGFAERGKGGELFESGRADPGGDLPVNTYGGLLSYGHAGDSSGASVLNEAITQNRGNAGERQVQDADVVLAHTYGGMMCEHVTTIFGRNPA